MRTLERQTIDQLEQLFLLDNCERPKPKQIEKSNAPMWSAFMLGAIATGVIAYSVPLWSQSEASLSAPPAAAIQPGPVLQGVGGFIPAHLQTLDAKKATITGIVDPETMSAAYYLSMVMHNSGSNQQEARMEIELPSGATVSRATLWINGVPQEAAFDSTLNVEQAYDSVTAKLRDPLLVRQVAPNKILVRAFPVMPGGDGLKLRIGITAPLELGTNGNVNAVLPRITTRNFGDSMLDIHLQRARSNEIIRAHTAGFDGDAPILSMPRNAIAQTFAVRATHSSNGGFIVARVTRDSAKPNLTFSKVLERPNCTVLKDVDAEHRISTLWAFTEVEKLAYYDLDRAVQLGKVYRVVSSSTGATVLENEADYTQFGLDRKQWSSIAYDGTTPPAAADTSAPQLQGATNGTMHDDATVIAGVNTSATVRVNNGANLEAGLNVVGNAAGPIGANAINWFTASARDANLFDSAGPAIEPSGNTTVGTVGTVGTVAGILLLIIPLFPLIALNFAAPCILLSRSFKRAFKGQAGAISLFAVGSVWLALAVVAPAISQVLAAIAAVMLLRRRSLQKKVQAATASP